MTVRDRVRELARAAVITAETTFRADQYGAYQRARERETGDGARWALEAMLANARIAEKKGYPLCDDTGIPHLFLEVGEGVTLAGEVLVALQEGVADGQRALPTRPMGVLGNVAERLSQSGGLSDDPAAVVPPAMVVKVVPGDELRVTLMMMGGGPEIRGKTFRVFHERSAEKVIREAATWAAEAAGQLGCTPIIPSIGIGRTHYEATTLMLEAIKDGDLDRQSDLENLVTDTVNATGTGAIGLGGSVTALGSFVRVGPARASGIRVVCMRPSCAVDPRRATFVLSASDLQERRSGGP
jgi:fumarate hydratase subunit alpha